MSNVVPPASERAHMRITTDTAAKVWRDGCAALWRTSRPSASRMPRTSIGCMSTPPFAIAA